MRWPNLSKTRALSRRPLSLLGLWVCGLIAALTIPVLICNFGLIVHWLISRDNGSETNRLIFTLYRQIFGLDTTTVISSGQQFIYLTATAAGLVLVEAISLVLHQRAVLALSQEVDAELKRKVYEQAAHIGPSDTFAQGATSAEIMLHQQTEIVRHSLVAWWRVIPYGMILLLGLLGVALAINFWLSTTAILLAIVIWSVYRNMIRPRVRQFAQTWDERAERHRMWLDECLSIVHLAQDDAEDFPGLNFSHELQEYQRASFRARLSQALRRPFLLSTILLAALFLLLIVGTAAEGRVSASTSMTLAAALICAYFPTASIFRLPQLLADGEVAAAKLLRFFQHGPAVLESADPADDTTLEQQITIHAVTLADAEGQGILSNLSLKIPAKHRIAIMSDDEIAPSALARLLLRHGDPAAGSISYDDCELRNAKLAQLRQHAVGVERRGRLFSASVSENITLGNQAISQAQIVEMTKHVGVHDFIQSLPDAYGTVIGISGRQMPAVQAFRITLARVLINKPSLLILEEPQTDFEEALLLDSQLTEIAKGRTLITLPASIVSLRKADAVIFLQQGNVAEQGTHGEILQRSELYRHIIYQRFNPFREDDMAAQDQ